MTPPTPTDSPDLGPTILAPDRFDEDVDEQEGDSRSRMSFLEHLDELRRRIIYSIYAILAGCALTFYYWNSMFRYLVTYFRSNGGTLIYSAPASAFMFSLKIGVLSGLLIALPFVFSQLWLFVAPGLYAREKKVVIPFAVSSTLLFAAGAAFAHIVAYPMIWKFFASYEIAGLQFYPTLDATFSFYVKMVLGLGAIFEMPMLVFFLARFGIVSAKFLIQKAKYAVLIIFIIAAIVTPSPDMMSQCIIAAPMLVLYGLSIGVAWMFGKRKNPARI